MMPHLSRAVLLTGALLLAATAASAQSSPLQGFADIAYVAREGDDPGGFDLGQLVGHAAFPLSNRITVFSEVSLTGRPNGYDVEAERLMLRYDFADFLKVSGGRYHTPVSYWNTAFHHGLWLQTSVGRPEYVKFGSRFVPVHFVGILAEGSFPSMRLAPGYFVGVGNGRGDNIARAGDAGDVNDARAWLGGFLVRPVRPFGLEAGVAVYRDRIGDLIQVDETIYSAYVVWSKERPEVLAEYAYVVHDERAGSADRVGNGAYYVQLAYRPSGRLAYLKAYGRLEEVDASSSDPLFASLGLDYDAVVVGLRFDLSMLSAIKVEYRNARFDTGERENSLYVQASFTFPGFDPD